jgi:tetratricopeptide (TPR) repeat protein
MMKKFIFTYFIFCFTLSLFGQGKANKLVEKGNEYLVSQNFAKAEDCYDRALSIDSMCFEAYIQKSDFEIQKSQFAKALEFINLARKYAELKNVDNESMAHILSIRSFIYFNLNNYQMAIQDMDSAISLNDQNSGYFFMRALIRRMNSDLKGCCSDLKKASNLGLEKAKESLTLYCK